MSQSLSKSGKGQVGMELMVLVALFLFFVFVVYYFTTTSSFQDLSTRKAEAAVDSLAAAADQVFSLGPGSSIVVTIEVPDSVTDNEVADTYVKLVMTTSIGDSDVVAFSKAELTGSIPSNPGIHLVTVTALSSGQVLIGDGLEVDPDSVAVALDAGDSNTQPLTVSNLLDENVTGITSSLEGDVNAFAVVSGLASSVPASGSDSFQIEFNPPLITSSGTYTGTLTVSGNYDSKVITNQTSVVAVITTSTVLPCTLSVTSYSDAACLTLDTSFSTGEVVSALVITDACTATDVNLELLDSNGNSKQAWSTLSIPITGLCLTGYTIQADDLNGTWNLVATSDQANDDITPLTVNAGPIPDSWYEVPDYFLLSDSNGGAKKDSYSNGATVYVTIKANGVTNPATKSLGVYNANGNSIDSTTLSWTESAKTATGSIVLPSGANNAFVKFELELSGGVGSFTAGQKVKVGAPTDNNLQLYTTYNALLGCSTEISDWNVSAGQTVCVQVTTSNLDNVSPPSSDSSRNRIITWDYAGSRNDFNNVFIKDPLSSNTYIAEITIPASYDSNNWFTLDSFIRKSTGASTKSHAMDKQFYVKP